MCYGDFYEDLSALFDLEQATQDELQDVVLKMGNDTTRMTLARRQWVNYLIGQLPEKPRLEDNKRDILLVLLGLAGVKNPIPFGIRTAKVENHNTSASDEMLIMMTEFLIKKALKERRDDLERMKVLEVVDHAYHKLEALLNNA